MKVVALIVEYNPFHNGHLYHIQQSKKISGADFVVCIMSGNFIQRGEPAIVNKWARARMALLSGIDLVIELPTVYAMASAEYFAHGAVSILNSLGIVNYICFGSESGNITELNKIADILHNEPDRYRTVLKKNLEMGLSYPSSREKALKEYIQSSENKDTNITSIVSCSNNILGIEYLKALKQLNSPIIPLTTCRMGNNYNSELLTGNISSATSIRRNIVGVHELSDSPIKNTIPASSLCILSEEFKNGRGPVLNESFENILLSFLRKLTKEQILSLPYVSEGLENRIIRAAQYSGSLNELIENVHTKRYTKTRIQRIVFSILTGLSSDELHDFTKVYGPQYIRVLGFNDKGRHMISEINTRAILPVIIKASDFKRSCNPLLRRMLEIEAQSTDMYVLGYSNAIFKKSGQDFTQNIIYMKN